MYLNFTSFHIACIISLQKESHATKHHNATTTTTITTTHLFVGNPITKKLHMTRKITD
jgi:hypothetical protein